MFGYVRPSDDRLTPADRETFRAAYCGLCHALGARYGLVGRMILNYDLTFLAMVLSDGAGEDCMRRCAVHPLRKRCCTAGDPALDAARRYYQTAVTMAPDNPEYQRALDILEGRGTAYRPDGYGNVTTGTCGNSDCLRLCGATLCCNALGVPVCFC